METLKPEIVALLQYLVPGFVAMMVYRKLIASPHPEAFRSTVDAMVFTGIIQFIVAGERWAAISIGRAFSFGEWTSAGQNTAAFVSAIAVGLIAVRCTSYDSLLFKHLRFLGLTAQASYPNEWFGTFKREEKKWVVLQLLDGRRLFGWPTEWPSSPETGHLRMQRAQWLPSTASGVTIDLPQISSILINVTDVRWVEFIEQMAGDTNDNQNADSAASHAPTQRARESAGAIGAHSPRSTSSATASPSAATAG